MSSLSCFLPELTKVLLEMFADALGQKYQIYTAYGVSVFSTVC